jgi:hypothetical protein
MIFFIVSGGSSNTRIETSTMADPQAAAKQHPPTLPHHTQLHPSVILQEKRPLASIVGVQEIQ